MLEILANSYFILVIGIVAALVTIISLEVEREGIATTAVSIALALLLWNYGRDVWEFVKSDYLTTTFFVLGYIIAGVIWSFLKWNEFVKKRVRIFKETKAKLILDRPDFNETNDKDLTELCDRLRNKGLSVWSHNINTINELIIKIMPLGSENKSSIIAWISYWPLSLLGTLLNNPFRRLFEYVYSLVADAYDKITTRHLKGLV
jgi:hypothetical protein